ncbi:hypothetical protein CC80DRAFT_496300 [Byssothecium circinans]|uniref:SnoaL-like domain-containing protein n=1 Tax=Byssothecium circinans TaxID=147558 RepID=A0A6A5TPZ2_9PLEO|nr:hypothetical protein CC80DRAFT_496300 [Byssothecium circinans]
MEKKESARLRTARAWIDVFTTLDPSPLHAILSPTYQQTYGPNTLASIGIGPYDKAGFIAYVSNLSNRMTSFIVTVDEIIDSESSNAVCAWTNTDARFRKEVTDGETWEYRGQSLLMFWFDGEGRIERCMEVVDSKKTLDELLPLFAKAKVNWEGVGE